MITLEKIKESLRIDYPDQDDYLIKLLQGEIIRAEIITGQDSICFNADIINGIKKGVESMFSGEPNEESIIIYRRNCKKPMF